MAHPIPRPQNFTTRVGRCATGLGLFAEERIPANRFIIEYWGPIVSDDEANRTGGKYLFDLENGTHILGGTRKNTARYANHSCDPNSEVRQTGSRIFIFSTRAIEPGEQITYDYGKEYFDVIIKPMGCLCAKCAKKKARRSA